MLCAPCDHFRSLSMVRGCALIDSRLDTAKIGSDGRVEVHRALLRAVFGGRKTFPHGLDPIRTSEAKNVTPRNESDSDPFSRCISNKQIAGSRCVKGTSLSHNSRTDVMKAWANKA